MDAEPYGDRVCRIDNDCEAYEMEVPIWVDDWDGTKDRIDIGDAVEWTVWSQSESPPPVANSCAEVRSGEGGMVRVTGRCWVPDQVRAPFFVLNARDFHVGISLRTGSPPRGALVRWQGRLWRWNHHDVDILPLLGQVRALVWHPLRVAQEWQEPRLVPAKGTRRHVIFDYEAQGVNVASTHDPRFVKADGAFCCTIEVSSFS